jgi:Mce-associated membrane protein
VTQTGERLDDQATHSERSTPPGEPDAVGGRDAVVDATNVGGETTDEGSAELSGAGDDQDTGDVEDALADDAEAEQDSEGVEPEKVKRRVNWSRVMAFGVLPGLVLLLAAAAGYLKWQDASARSAQVARLESVSAAKDSTIALLSYQPDTVERDLGAAQNRLTGTFQHSYTQLIHDVVIPGAKQKHISAIATVPAAASVSATANHAVALVFVDQTTVVGTDPPTNTSSTVRVTVDKIAGHWLISDFTPV